MKKWIQKTGLDGCPRPQFQDIWEYQDGDQVIASFSVDITISKSLDVLQLKNTSLSETREYADFLNKTAQDLYKPARVRREVSQCPCCNADTRDALEETAIFGVPYHRCRVCGHVFVRSQPTQEALNELFTESEEHATLYTDMKSLEIRLEQVIKPKIDWLSRVYQHTYSHSIKTGLDVGAGAGHFIEGLRRQGIQGAGYELSKASRRFAKEIFQLDLLNSDFLTSEPMPKQFDVITFWGLLEYTQQPGKVLQVARQWFESGRGMLVVEVPRFNCFGSAIQKVCTTTVARHLDPTSHVNAFTDSSLATVLFNNGFKPVAVWYFGMDFYEFLVQLALERDDPSILEGSAHLIPVLQNTLDYGRICDDIIVAAVPFE